MPAGDCDRSDLTSGLWTRVRSFRTDQSGGTIILFSLGFMVLLLAAAVAIDYGRAEIERQQMQRALDAAALAAAHKIGQPDQDEQIRAVAESYFRANTPANSTLTIDSITVNPAAGEVRMTSGGNVMTTLLSAFGINTIAVGGNSRVVRGERTVELALVLDNSGSMAGTPLQDLKTATQNLTNVIFAGAEGNDKVRIGIVPFAGSVKLGPEVRDASWIDHDGESPVHFENFAEQKTRHTLFSQLGVEWAGCVEARPAPYDTNDATPTAGNPATLFVPMFAPDEPDDVNDGGNSYPNNYLSDFGGACPTPEQVCVKYNTRKQRCDQWGPKPLTPAVAQGRTCKYDGGTPTGAGPNAGCTTQPIMDLTSDRTAVTAAIDSMIASGTTNIGEGLMWGWRLLSPEAPYTTARSFHDVSNQKFIILMTDGQNTYNRYSNPNWTFYGAFGYGVKERLGTTNSSNAMLAQMNAKTLAACANAKAQGITVYTIAFRLESDPATLSLLSSCATSVDKAYRAGDGSALINTFQAIAREIAQLRIAG